MELSIPDGNIAAMAERVATMEIVAGLIQATFLEVKKRQSKRVDHHHLL